MFVTKQSFCNRSLLITGQTLVSFACSNLITKGLVEQVSYILDKGADPTIVDIDGLNAVSFACPVLSSMFVWCYTRWNCIIFTLYIINKTMMYFVLYSYIIYAIMMKRYEVNFCPQILCFLYTTCYLMYSGLFSIWFSFFTVGIQWFKNGHHSYNS